MKKSSIYVLSHCPVTKHCGSGGWSPYMWLSSAIYTDVVGKATVCSTVNQSSGNIKAKTPYICAYYVSSRQVQSFSRVRLRFTCSIPSSPEVKPSRSSWPHLV